MLAREAGRLETSLCSAEAAGLEPIVFLHYPPIYGTEYNYDILDVMYRHNIKSAITAMFTAEPISTPCAASVTALISALYPPIMCSFAL